ncbi:MAG TPA: flagellar biosynthesis protein FlhF [Syntrophomonadaceae bacterium]|nr:flagellar biosynthesis protein FlhF [Syntrophomonadaceae bacterium]
MKVKKYVAKDFQSAITQAKMEMGKDAIILSSRQVRRKGLRGFFSRPYYEVTVAMDKDLRVEMDRRRNHMNSSSPMAAFDEKNSSLYSSERREQELLDELKHMKLLMDDIKSRMHEMDVIKGVSEPAQEFYQLLLKKNVKKEIALRLAARIDQRLPRDQDADPDWIRDIYTHTVQECLGEAQPIVVNEQKGKVVVMVGPTGVGKTTTIAKLAANMTFMEAKEVAFITLDTYRISAAEQLRTFAEIIGIPIRIVFHAADLIDAIQEFRHKDLIFIDTAGRSPYNNDHMGELHEFLRAAQADEVILVLSATTDSTDLIQIYERFNLMCVDKLIFTKLDETNSYGQILNVLDEVDKPVAYFTTGQSVPDDIEVPDPLRFAKMLIEGKDA